MVILRSMYPEFCLLTFIDLAPVAYKLNYDYVMLHSINRSPVSYSELKCSFQFTSQRFRDNALEVLTKPGEPSQNSSSYRLIKPFQVFYCSLSPLNRKQSCLPPHHVELYVRDFPDASSVHV